MASRKLIAALIALLALGAGVLLLVSRQDAKEDPAEVLLPPPSTAGAAQSAVRLTVPRRYISPSGTDNLFLEIERAGATPLRIELSAHDSFSNGLGERRRDEAMNQPPGSRKQLIVPPPDHPQDIIGYLFANIPGATAYYFKANEEGVFVDCSERPRCYGFQTWRGLLDVQYEYSRAAPDDPRPINATVQQLLESFKPSAIPLSQLSDQSQDEKPIFEPVSAN